MTAYPDWIVAGLDCHCRRHLRRDPECWWPYDFRSAVLIINPNVAGELYLAYRGANVSRLIGRDYLPLVERIARECDDAGGPVPADEGHVTVFDDVYPRIVTEVVDLLATISTATASDEDDE